MQHTIECQAGRDRTAEGAPCHSDQDGTGVFAKERDHGSLVRQGANHGENEGRPNEVLQSLEGVP